MIRRITAGAAGLALAGTAFAAPAMAASNTTVITLDNGLVSAATAAGVSASAIKPAKLAGTKLSLKAKLVGKTVTHKGGISFKGAAGEVGLKNFEINWKNGSTDATAVAAGNDVDLAKVLKVSGGKKTSKAWKNATLKLSKSIDFGGAATDPATLVNQLVTGNPATPFKSGQTIGKITITLK
jgi:hypothetical protein